MTGTNRSDLSITPVHVDDISAYLSSRGWRRFEGGRVADLWARTDTDAELLVPLIPAANDFNKRVNFLVMDLAKIENRDAEEVRSDIANVHFDVSEVMATGSPEYADSIPLEVGTNLFRTVKRLVVASAAATIRRQGHFGRSLPEQARQQARQVRVGHTRRGSYVVPVISRAVFTEVPGNDQEAQLEVEAEELLFDRRVMITMARALSSLSGLTQVSSVPSTRDIVGSVGDGVSRELCTAVAGIVAPEAAADVEVGFHWSPTVTAPIHVPSRVGFSREMASRIEHIGEVLKQAPEEREDVLYGVVTSLEQDPDETTATVGVQTIVNRRKRTVWTQLGGQDHAIAVHSYTTKQRVVIRGRLRAPRGGDATMDVSSIETDESAIIPTS